MTKLKTFFNWSTGKDSALALYYLLQDKNYSVDHLLTSVNASHDRVSMHGLRRELLEQQIEALGISYSTVELSEEPSMPQYETGMNRAVTALQRKGFECAAFGDIFLEDLRQYREEQLLSLNIRSIFPLWKKDTTALLNEFNDLGFKAIIVCIKEDLLDISFAGRVIDQNFIKDLPAGVDPCGENGEFHTFCFDGPIFKNSIPFTVGEKTYRQYSKENMGFWFCDLLPVK